MVEEWYIDFGICTYGWSKYDLRDINIVKFIAIHEEWTVDGTQRNNGH